MCLPFMINSRLHSLMSNFWLKTLGWGLFCLKKNDFTKTDDKLGERPKHPECSRKHTVYNRFSFPFAFPPE